MSSIPTQEEHDVATRNDVIARLNGLLDELPEEHFRVLLVHLLDVVHVYLVGELPGEAEPRRKASLGH